MKILWCFKIFKTYKGFNYYLTKNLNDTLKSNNMIRVITASRPIKQSATSLRARWDWIDNHQG